MNNMTNRLGIDIGGTFTDLYLFDNEKSKVLTCKVPTTSNDYTIGVFNAIMETGINLSYITDIIHGSTIATNAVIERKLPTVPFITTKGFRDIIEIGRYHREKLYDPYQTKPIPLVKRRFRYEISERVDSSGNVLIDLNEKEAMGVINEIKEMKTNTVAIGFLNSYANPMNEEKMRELILKEMPTFFVSISSSVLGKIRPLGRFNITILNAALKPIITAYINSLIEKLRINGFGGRLWLSQSNGGIIASNFIENNPELMLLSGPSMGVIACSYLCKKIGKDHVISLDMGGTSTDVSVIDKGVGFITTERQIDWDMPIPTPMMNIETIGAGGGSIAWCDPGGILKVGPQSAGSNPGPVCYNRGGTEPTVTDANLLLGRLSPRQKLGRDVKLDRQLAMSAIENLGKRINLDWLDCAKGIIRVVEENMANAVKRVLISKSRDPRDYILVAFGGAGPMHACSVAKLLGIPFVISPFYSGVLCAFGTTLANVIHNIENTFYAPLRDVDIKNLNENFNLLEKKALNILLEEGIDKQNIVLNRIAEMRYVGQTYEVDTMIPSKKIDEEDLLLIKRQFDQAHDERFGLSFPNDMVAFVNLRCNAIGKVPKQELQYFESIKKAPQVIEEREIYFSEFETSVKTKVYNGQDILPDMSFLGPLSIELRESTVIVPPNSSVIVDNYKNIIIKI